jgi:23S rRNA pseudouridine2605 synthase
MSDEQGRPTVRELTEGCPARVYPVGRLDLNSEGLLLLTDDGDAAKKLTHPSHSVDKEYLVWVTGDADAAIPALRKPMILDGVILRPAKVRKLEGRTEGATLLSMTIHEGKNRQIRRMCEAAGLHVVRLRRIAVGNLKLGDLPSGKWRNLTEEEIAYIKSI